MNLAAQLKSITEKVTHAEKVAEKQLKDVFKSTEAFREKQLKAAQEIFKKAQKLRESQIAKKADKVRKDLEARAAEGMDSVMGRLNLPTKKELEKLRKQISSLQKRLDELEKPNTSA